MPAKTYNDKLSASDQIDTEEQIASKIFDTFEDCGLSEEDAAEMGREILLMVLTKFRPDLVTK